MHNGIRAIINLLQNIKKNKLITMIDDLKTGSSFADHI